MYLFYQLHGGEESWKVIEDSADNRRALKEKKAAFVSILAISATNNVDYEKVKYKGDLYFDIDSPELTESIKIVNNLIEKLNELEVVNYKVFLSGKKGFHLTIPAKVFSKGAQVTYLPYIYAKMAEKLNVSGLDFAVYSAGMGRLWRQEDILRKGINTFKVQVDPKILPRLTEEQYRVLVSSPTMYVNQDEDIVKSLPLSEIYEYSKQLVIEEEKTRLKYEFEKIPELEELKEIPGCIKKLAIEGDEKRGANFNKAAMQMAGYIKSANLDEKASEELIKLMAANTKSSTYNSERAREQHLKSQIRRAKQDPRMGFNPSYLFSTIEPCGNCILCNGELDKYYKPEGQRDAEMEVEGCPIFVSDNAYFIRQGKFDRQITTFTLEALHYSEVFDEYNRTLERESVTVNIVYNHLGETKSYTRSIPERAWDSSTAFKRAVSGIDNVSWLGADSDIAQLKHYLFSKGTEMGRITKVKSCGISAYEIMPTKKKCLVYVEPGFSKNAFNEVGTHELHNNLTSAPEVFNAPPLENNEKFTTIAKEITKINASDKMALVLGWYVACHFKPHFMAIEKQFPLLGLWGNAGSGKTKTASIMAYLHGMDYEGEHSMASCGGSTPWSLAKFISTSTSTPRLIDEFNKAKLKGQYNKIVALFKDCFNENSHIKGQLSSRGEGAEVSETKLTGPVVMMSEQFPTDEPPLIQRTITVKLSRKSREGCEDSWNYVYGHRKDLVSIAKALVDAALKTRKKTIQYWMDYYYDKIPPESRMESRPHYSFRVALTGLKMYELTLASADIDVSEEVKVLEQSLLASLNEGVDNISQAKSRSVVDDVIDVMAQMATDARKAGRYAQGMVYGVGYIRDAENVWIDAEAIYSTYKVYMRSIGEIPVLTNYRQFRNLLGEEDYFVGEELVEALTRSRPCIMLSVPKMIEKGISANLFEYDEDDE